MLRSIIASNTLSSPVLRACAMGVQSKPILPFAETRGVCNVPHLRRARVQKTWAQARPASPLGLQVCVRPARASVRADVPAVFSVQPDMPMPRPCRLPRASLIGCFDEPMPRPRPLRASCYAKHRQSPVEVQTRPCSLYGSNLSSDTSIRDISGQRGSVFQNVPFANKRRRVDAFTIQAAVHESVFNDARAVWIGIRGQLLPFSPVLKGAAQSSSVGLEDRLLRTVSESTLLRYLSQLRVFLFALRDMELRALDNLQQFQILDALLVTRKNGDHVSNSLKAVCWANKLFELPLPDLYLGLMRTAEVQVTNDRRESIPLLIGGRGII